jgi:hypothetical protein
MNPKRTSRKKSEITFFRHFGANPEEYGILTGFQSFQSRKEGLARVFSSVRAF